MGSKEIGNSAADKVKPESEDRDFTPTMRFDTNRSKVVLPVTDFERPEESETHDGDQDAEALGIFKMSAFQVEGARVQRAAARSGIKLEGKS